MVILKNKYKQLNIRVMKKLVLSLVIMFAVGLTATLSAQTTIDRLYDKYAGTDGFTSINISPEMFNMISGMSMSDSSEEAKEAQDAMSQLSGLKILTYEAEEGEVNEAFMNEVKALTKIEGYSELMSVQDGDEIVKFLVSKTPDGKVSELLMIVHEESEAVVMSMTGNLDMQTISQISRTLEIDGMENLDELDEK